MKGLVKDLKPGDRLVMCTGMPGSYEAIVCSVEALDHLDEPRIEVWVAPQTPDALDPECRNFGRRERYRLHPELVVRHVVVCTCGATKSAPDHGPECAVTLAKAPPSVPGWEKHAR